MIAGGAMERLLGKHAFVRQLRAAGVRYVFGNPGTLEQGFLDALQDHPGIEFILALHEGVAVTVADAYARATRRPAFVQLHAAPGLGNAIGMLYDAYMGRTPLVVYAGQSDSHGLFQEPSLSGDLVAMARPVTKWAYEVRHAAELPQVIRRAFKIAQEQPRGPVVLAIPLDVLDAVADVEIVPPTYVAERARPDRQALGNAADLLCAARDPALLVADGVSASDAISQVSDLARLLGAPIHQGYSTEVNVAPDEPLNAGQIRGIHPSGYRDSLAGVDVLVAVGTDLVRLVFPTAEPTLPSSTRIIHIDQHGWELAKNQPSLAIQADPRETLIELTNLVSSRLTPAARERAAARKAATEERLRRTREKVLAADRQGWDRFPMSPARAMFEVSRVLPDDTLIMDESVTGFATVVRYVRPGPGRYFRARGGGLGPGLAGVLGLKLAHPNRPAVGIVGDGAAMYTSTAFWSAAHHRLRVIWIVMNNSSYKILKQNLAEYLGPAGAGRRSVGADLDDPPIRFDRLAEAMGVHGRRASTPEELREALAWSLGADGPTLVDTVVG